MEPSRLAVLRRVGVAFRKNDGVGFHHITHFGAQYRSHVLPVYASPKGYPVRRNTRFQLPGRLRRVGLATHRVLMQGFYSAVFCLLSPLPRLGLAHRFMRFVGALTQ